MLWSQTETLAEFMCFLCSSVIMIHNLCILLEKLYMIAQNNLYLSSNIEPWRGSLIHLLSETRCFSFSTFSPSFWLAASYKQKVSEASDQWETGKKRQDVSNLATHWVNYHTDSLVIVMLKLIKWYANLTASIFVLFSLYILTLYEFICQMFNSNFLQRQFH